MKALLLILAVFLVGPGDGDDKGRRGNAMYRTGEYMDAANLYRDALVDVQRDTVLRFPAGRRVHELTNPDGDIYVMFAYEVDSMDADIADFDRPDALDGHPIPTGWTYSSRRLPRDLVLDSSGVVSVLSFRGSGPLSTWEKR